MIEATRIRALLELRGLDVRVEVRPTTESTNDDAKEAARLGMAVPALFVADEQTRGRGRSGNAWLSTPGESVLLSILLRPDLAPADSARLTLAVGVAISDIIEARAPGRVRVKWPNDVLLDDKKIAGILLEGQIRGEKLSSLVIGVGLNVHAAGLPAELASIATSLTIAGVVRRDRSELTAEIAAAIISTVDRFGCEGLAGFIQVLRSRDALLGERIEVGEVVGTADGIDESGRLIVLTSSGHHVPVVSGHVIRRSGSL